MNVSVEWWRQKPDCSQFNKKMAGEELESMSTTDCVEVLLQRRAKKWNSDQGEESIEDFLKHR